MPEQHRRPRPQPWLMLLRVLLDLLPLLGRRPSHDPHQRPSRRNAFWVGVLRLTSPIVYGLAVTLLLALYMAVFRHGNIWDLPLMLRMVFFQITPWFVIAYEIARRILPDVQLITRPPSVVMLPMIEGVTAVACMATLLAIGGEITDPYANFALDAFRLITSVLAGRLFVRTVFRY